MMIDIRACLIQDNFFFNPDGKNKFINTKTVIVALYFYALCDLLNVIVFINVDLMLKKKISLGRDA